jgi:phage baseplate assembly protein W
MPIAFPLRFDGRGRTVQDDDDGHVRGLVEQVLFTSPGERLNRPDFGTGLAQLVFAPGGDELAAAIELLVQGALQQWLGDLLQLEAVEVESEDSTLRVSVRYTVTRTQERRTERFAREVAA